MAKFNIIDSLKTVKELSKELSTRLRALTFDDNFKSFEKEITIPATTEVSIRNELTTIPNYVINVGQTGNGLVTKGDTAWNINYLTIKNNGAASVTVKLLFLR